MAIAVNEDRNDFLKTRRLRILIVDLGQVVLPQPRQAISEQRPIARYESVQSLVVLGT